MPQQEKHRGVVEVGHRAHCHRYKARYEVKEHLGVIRACIALFPIVSCRAPLYDR